MDLGVAFLVFFVGVLVDFLGLWGEGETGVLTVSAITLA